jgi:hypothetical protein
MKTPIKNSVGEKPEENLLSNVVSNDFALQKQNILGLIF